MQSCKQNYQITNIITIQATKINTLPKARCRWNKYKYEYRYKYNYKYKYSKNLYSAVYTLSREANEISECKISFRKNFKSTGCSGKLNTVR